MKRYLAPAGLAVALAIAVVMAVLEPVPQGRRYDLAIQLTLALGAIWVVARAPFRKLFRKGVLAAVFLIGLVLAASQFASIDPDSEIVRYYGSAFEALDGGRNPYTAGTIFHRGADGTPIFGNFNYPPLELYPYYLAYRIAGRWDSSVLTGVMIVINALGCVVLVLTFPSVRASGLAAFFPLLMFGEIRTTPSLTFLATALLLGLIVRETRRPTRAGPWLIAVAFGFALMTKFLALPLMAAYYAHRLDLKKPASLGTAVGGGTLALATSALIMAPFGLTAVLKNTWLFNLVLEDRAALTTFYPNVLSGPLKALGWGGLYPVAAVAAVGAAVLAAPRLRLFPALLAAVFVFLLAAPTPEPQYLPTVLYVALAFRCLEIERDGGAESPGSPA
jgi:hypothetical protein